MADEPSSGPPEAFPPDAEKMAADMPGDPRHLRIGRLGEDLACRYLWKKGFRILVRNYRAGRGEIDVIAERRGRLHIVEVKTRTSESLGDPEMRVDEDKRRMLRDTAARYLGEFRDPPAGGVQFDVVSQVLDDRSRPVRQTLIESVF